MRSLKEGLMTQMRGLRMRLSADSGVMERPYGRFADQDFVEETLVPIDDDEEHPVEIAVGEVVYAEGRAHFRLDGVRYRLQSAYDDQTGDTVAVAIAYQDSTGVTDSCTLNAETQTCTMNEHHFDLAFFGSVGVATRRKSSSGEPQAPGCDIDEDVIEGMFNAALAKCREERGGYAWTCDQHARLRPKCAEVGTFFDAGGTNTCVPVCANKEN
jgi:hypothetical protein